MRKMFRWFYSESLKLGPITVVHGENFAVQIQQRLKKDILLGIVLFGHLKVKLSPDDNFVKSITMRFLCVL